MSTDVAEPTSDHQRTSDDQGRAGGSAVGDRAARRSGARPAAVSVGRAARRRRPVAGGGPVRSGRLRRAVVRRCSPEPSTSSGAAGAGCGWSGWARRCWTRSTRRACPRCCWSTGPHGGPVMAFAEPARALIDRRPAAADLVAVVPRLASPRIRTGLTTVVGRLPVCGPADIGQIGDPRRGRVPPVRAGVSTGRRAEHPGGGLAGRDAPCRPPRGHPRAYLPRSTPPRHRGRSRRSAGLRGSHRPPTRRHRAVARAAVVAAGRPAGHAGQHRPRGSA